MMRISKLFLTMFRLFDRVRNKCFSLLISGAFARFGKKSVLCLPLRISGEERIQIGEGVFLGPGCWLQALPDGSNSSSAISIGSGCSVAGYCVISGVREVRLERNVLLARNVYISDHIHRYSDRALPILAQGLDKILPVHIKEGAWLGQNVVICPGVTIGAGAVVGANSVVKSDVPDFSVAVGAPARVVSTRSFAVR